MANYEIKLNHAGVVELLKSAEIQAAVKAHADATAASCGPGYKSKAYMTHDRATAIVAAVTPEAAQDNLDHNTIMRNLK